MKKLTAILSLTYIFCGCNSSDNSKFINASNYVSKVFKLSSPNNNFALYRYYIQYPRAHSGYTRFTVIADTSKFNPSSDYFSFSDTLYGFNILGWKGDTIKTLCIVPNQNPPQTLIPYKVQITKWKNWYWQVDYYYGNEFYGNTNKYFDSLVYLHDSLIFIGKDTCLGETEPFRINVVKGQLSIPVGDSIIQVNRLESLATIDAKYNNGDTIRKPPLVSISSYTLKPKGKIDWNKLKRFGVFIEQAYPK